MGASTQHITNISIDSLDIHSGVNLVEATETFIIDTNKEMVVSSLTVDGILVVNGILTILN